ncbi:MAG: hypothetical protein U9R57_08000 [Thermodesulfobacteriota bacterium]|nr:hypothetical protein [Thermodesulfobacteriota bacterium]
MKEFIKKFSGLVKETISGFDRIVFKDLVLPLMSSSEVMSFFRSRSILNKDYKPWMLQQTAGVIECAEKYAKEACGHGIGLLTGTPSCSPSYSRALPGKDHGIDSPLGIQ